MTAPPHGHPAADTIAASPRRTFAPPQARDELVPRARLLDELIADRTTPVLLVAAGPGYGKTTLLAQWAAADSRSFAWIHLRPEHDDPVLLVEEVVAALGEVTVLGGPVPRTTGAVRPPVESRILPALARAVRRAAPGFVLVLDDAQAVSSPLSLAVLRTVATSIPDGSRLAMGARGAPEIGVAALRAARALQEIGHEELAMGEHEAAGVLAETGAGLSDEDVTEVVRRTEGWPAGIYLAGLALHEGRASGGLGDLPGDHHLIADYIREELLEDLPPSDLDFLVETSLLDRLSGPVCDDLRGTGDGAVVLRALARRNRLIIPLDARREWFRYHPLFADTLRAELAARSPERARALHARAGDMCAAAGDGEGAVEHALAAGRRAEAAGRIWCFTPIYGTQGRVGTVVRWLERFSGAEHAADAHLALSMAWLHVETRSDLAARWMRTAEIAGHDGPLADGSTLAAQVALLRATMGADGVARMGEDAETAAAGLGPGNPFATLCCLFAGAAAHLRGDEVAGRARLEEGLARIGVAIPTMAALCISWLGVIAEFAGDEAEMIRRAGETRAVIEEAGLDEMGSAALGYALVALADARSGRRARAAHGAGEARRLLAQIDDVAPFFAVTTRLLLARTRLALGDPAAAAALAAEWARHLPAVADAPVLLRECARTRDMAGGGAAAEPLTAAERRLLAYLPTHFSFREIATRVGVSRFTVKSQAASIYRKLGASSRGEAVERAEALGLIGPAEAHPPTRAGAPDGPDGSGTTGRTGR